MGEYISDTLMDIRCRAVCWTSSLGLICGMGGAIVAD